MNQDNQKGAGNQPNKGGAPEPRPPSFLNPLIIMFVITIVINLIFSMYASNAKMNIEYSQFLTFIDEGYVDVVELGETDLQFTMNQDADVERVREILSSSITLSSENVEKLLSSQSTYQVTRVEDPELTARLYDKGVTFYKLPDRSSPLLSFITSWIFPVLLLYLFYYFFTRSMRNRMGDGGGGMFGGVGKSKAKVYDMQTQTGVTFKDVAGQDEAKESLGEIIDFLHDPEKYRQIGAKQIKGALLVGPPGTGKTLLARAVAGEAKVPYFSLSGSEFVEMFVGVGASRVRDLFEQAKKNAPCIIFIDEIDAIGKSRDNQLGSNDEREQTLNQLLAEMDGFDPNSGIVVLAATNRPEVLDKALLRPGRFDRRIIVEKPDLPGRESILKVHAAKVRVGSDVNLHDVALATSGATGADLANMVNEAALQAVRLGRTVVSQKDLMDSVEVVIAGKEKKDRILNPTEKKMVAYHEVGHALVSALQKKSQPVQKITIVPRTMGALGFTMNMPEEERYLMTEEELLAQIRTLLGGRAAEQVIFGETTTGASNDIERATQLARAMVTQYGMSRKFGPMGLESTQSRYLDGRNVANCSEATGAEIDAEVRNILLLCHDEAKELLEKNRESLERISNYLIDKETISGEVFMNLLHEKTDADAETEA